MKRICYSCKNEKELNEFSKNKSHISGINPLCKKCDTKRSIEHKRTRRGIVSRIYNDQKKANKRRKHGRMKYSQIDLFNWLDGNVRFDSLYKAWVKSGYIKDLKPSLDRTDDYKGYSLDRLIITTWGEHNRKSYEDKKNGVNTKQCKAVNQFTRFGVLIETFYSMAEAQRRTGVRDDYISRCCTKPFGKFNKLLSAGGFHWRYA